MSDNIELCAPLHACVARSKAVYSTFGVTSLGQHYALFLRKRALGGYSVYLSTADRRNTPKASEPLKISSPVILEEGMDLIKSLEKRLKKAPLFSLAHQPDKVEIPASRELLTLHRLPESVLASAGVGLLEKGDELFIECAASGVTFFHSGIYAGDGMVYHFLNESDSSSLAGFLRTFAPLPGKICLDSFHDFVYALTEENGTIPTIFRVSYALRVRSGNAIVEWAEIVKQSKSFTQYDIRYRNCQHFSSLCSTGLPYSYDMDNQFKFLACSILNTSGSALHHNGASLRRASSSQKIKLTTTHGSEGSVTPEEPLVQHGRTVRSQSIAVERLPSHKQQKMLDIKNLLRSDYVDKPKVPLGAGMLEC